MLKGFNFASNAILLYMLKRLFLFLILAWAPFVQAQDGDALLKKYGCKGCHKMDAASTGPALMGAVERWEGDKDEMKKFIKLGAADYIKGGNKKSKYIEELKGKMNGAVMAAQGMVPDADVDAILAYIEGYQPPAAGAPGAPGEAGAAQGAGAPAGGGLSDSTMLYGLLTLVVIFGAISIILVVVISVILGAISAKDRGQKFTYGDVKKATTGLLKNKFVLTLIALVIIGGVLDKGYQFVAHIGFHDGYRPVQPVAFSHKLHAGQFQINCQYCHIGVDKGKEATIPSTNICMNCHAAINEGPKYKTQEIAKVVKAHNEGKAIEWVRIHNLPDLVYFNHAQHVKVGGLECQTCHGPVQEMEEVYQYSRLTMAWCINCHRNKAVKFKENAYYQHVHHNVRNEMNEGKIDSVTVARLGGMECARCHY